MWFFKKSDDKSFEIVFLGTLGGGYTDNLSSYLVRSIKSPYYACLDAGSPLTGLKKAIESNQISHTKGNEFAIMKNNIMAYIISHAHLDHVAGLALQSCYDKDKNIYATAETIKDLETHLFNSRIWPKLKNLHFNALPFNQTTKINKTKLIVEPFLLNHPGQYHSSAFLIQHNDQYLVYFGDTAPDALEEERRLYAIWQKITPLLKEKKIKAIFIECSLPNEVPDKVLYGHLTPKYLMGELRTVATMVNPEFPEAAFQGTKVIITHIKPTEKEGTNASKTIIDQLEKLNDLAIDFLIPEQGTSIRV